MQELAKVDDIPIECGLRVRVDDKYIALFKVNGGVHAINAICPHAGAFLDMGYLDGPIVTCPLHGWDFDVRDGKSPTFGIKTACYEIEIADGVVYLKE